MRPGRSYASDIKAKVTALARKVVQRQQRYFNQTTPAPIGA